MPTESSIRALAFASLATACSPPPAGTDAPAARAVERAFHERTSAEGPTTADVTLPARADATLVVRDRATRTTVGVRLEGARATAPTEAGRSVVYRSAAPQEADVVARKSGVGAEDFVVFTRRPAREELVYRIDVSATSGLRFVANVLELLDADGTPRLRMAAPYVVGADGRRSEATVALADCKADVSGEGPWGRPVTPPGKGMCAVHVGWAGARVTYPAVVDPSWASTKNNMVAPRRNHAATLLSNGTVLLSGGETPGGAKPTHLASAELFDPKTDTFAATGSMMGARAMHSSVLLKNGKVLVAGGADDANSLASSEVYDGGTFHMGGQMLTARAGCVATLLGTDEALITGGVDAAGKVSKAAELFDPTMEKWSPAPDMSYARTAHGLATLANGSALVVAGITTTTVADVVACEIYTPVTRKWASTGMLSEARYAFGSALLSDGRFLVASGYSLSASGCTKGAEIYDFGKAGWAKAGTLATGRTEHTLTALPSGGAVAAGGVVRDASKAITSYLKSVEVYDPVGNTWSALPDMKQARSSHTATLLPDGRVLVAGGDTAAGPTATAELLSFDPNGTACKIGATCSSGFCVDGVCCESECTKACNACAAASTGKPDGTCAPAQAGKDPHGDCKDDGAVACKKDGFCDGAGACEDYATACKPSPCAKGDDCTSGFCADGICCDKACTGECDACTTAKRGSGKDGECGPVAKGTDPDAECGTLGTGVCKGTGTCDGASACKVSTEGKDCAPAQCSDAVTLARAATCNASGACAPDTLDCSPYLCDAMAVACTKSCTTDTECAPGAHCDAGACAKNANGETCAKNVECASGFCADGRCCNKACGGQCEACDGSGTEGQCLPVKGTPRGIRGPCDGSGTCAGTCNGIVTMTCIYPGSDVTCEGSASSCTDGMETVSRCNGSAVCVPTPRACTPYACGANACKTSCSSNADCSAGVSCVAGACNNGKASTCSGPVMLALADGGSRSCAPYHCTEDKCTDSCTTDAECTAGATCTAGKCQLPAKEGCNCRLAASEDPGGRADFRTALLVLAAVLGTRRRGTRRRRTNEERHR